MNTLIALLVGLVLGVIFGAVLGWIAGVLAGSRVERRKQAARMKKVRGDINEACSEFARDVSKAVTAQVIDRANQVLKEKDATPRKKRAVLKAKATGAKMH